MAATNRGPFGVDVQSPKQLGKLMRDLRKVAPDVAKETRAKFKKAATPVLNDAHKRQPKKTDELRRKTKIRIGRGRVEIRSSAPHARISEFGGRHPLWGDRDKWVEQKAQPAIFPAAAAGRQQFVKEAKAAVYVACKKAGFK
jgi:HK97 gp10 family phage protein